MAKRNAKKANAKTKAPICPRCDGPVPCAATPGAYDGALSRADGETEVCSACGVDEAHLDFVAWIEAGRPDHYVPGNTKVGWKRPDVARSLLTGAATVN